jgi:hypothetical protein
MAQIRPLDFVVNKYTQVTPGRTEQYRAGVSAPRRPWAAQAAAAGPSYRQAVTAAAGAGRYEAGVARAGDAKWSRGAVGKGPDRFATGVSAAGPDFQAGFAPYHQVIQATALPPKGPRGQAANIERVRVMSSALHQRRTGAAGR